MRFAMVLASSVMLLIASTGRAQTRPVDPTVTSPIHYADQEVVVSTNAGTAIIRFYSTDDGNGKQGARYHFRFLPVEGAEQRGEGEVFENYQRPPAGQSGRLIDRGSNLKLAAGRIALDWSFGGDGFGWIYFLPEEATVQCISISQFENLELSRFKK